MILPLGAEGVHASLTAPSPQVAGLVHPGWGSWSLPSIPRHTHGLPESAGIRPFLQNTHHFAPHRTPAVGFVSPQRTHPPTLPGAFSAKKKCWSGKKRSNSQHDAGFFFRKTSCTMKSRGFEVSFSRPFFLLTRSCSVHIHVNYFDAECTIWHCYKVAIGLLFKEHHPPNWKPNWLIN